METEMQSNSRESLCVLMIDDDEEDVYIIKRHLSQSKLVEYELLNEGTLSAGASVLEMREPDAVLLDLNLGASIGLDTLRKFKKNNEKFQRGASSLPDLTMEDRRVVGKMHIFYTSE